MNSPAGNGKVRLEMQRVSRQYRQGDTVINVLREANLAIRGGEMTALVGPSGSGKSTLLNIAGLLERPSEGDVIIDGTPTGGLSSRKRGRLRGSHVGFVFQFHRLLPEFSALENVMIPQMLGGLGRLEAEARAEQLLGMIGLADRREHRPGALSGGEQQRVAIARAVANAPRVLLAGLIVCADMHCVCVCVCVAPMKFNTRGEHIVECKPRPVLYPAIQTGGGAPACCVIASA
ncbi:MAG: ABC transporter ATP-binding protein, partial [Candidatus Puniceispirillaceae bacterium]